MTTIVVPLRRAVALLGLLVLAVLAAPAAQAHDVLIASDPEEGAVLTEAPEAIVLTFNNAPLPVGSAISVVDADGATLAEGQGAVEGTDVVLPLDAELGAGELEVRWRVASSDGHPIDGTIAFTVETVAAEPAATTAPEPAPPTAGPTPVAVAETAPVATAEPAEDTAADSPGGLGALPLWLRVAVGLAVLASVVGLIIRVSRRLRDERP